ncbi:MAG: methyltransferase domain-containing protein [Desulfuromonadales bacterium]|nr:methyltransferase domain-containing protein [Desulfuromonadales bacterium]
MPEQQGFKDRYEHKGWFDGGEIGFCADCDEQSESLPQYLEECFAVIEAEDRPRKVLDIGCGYGTHLAVAVEKGWECFGVEGSEHARKIAKKRHGDSLYLVERVDDLPPCQFDLILLLDIIEHLADPYVLFYNLFTKGVIGPRTRIVITTPNAKSLEAVADPVKWANRHHPSHLVYYSPQSLNTLLNQLKWSAVEITGQYPVPGFSAKSDNEASGLNEKLSGYNGLLCTATGSDFSEFMHERYVPGTWNKIAEYEHLPRYVMAQKMASGLRVLDFGCGTGYGSALLAKDAEAVVGVDISEEALRWAMQHQHNPCLRFERRDDLGAGLPASSFDLVTCFEMIEHVSAETQELVIKNFRKILRAEGKLVISTPNPQVTENYGENPYHLHEMSEKEFVTLLKHHFKYVQIFRQWIRPSVLIAQHPLPSVGEGVQAYSMAVDGASFDLPAVAYVAVCSDIPIGEVEGVCNFDSSFDYVEKSISDINVLNHERLDKYFYFLRSRNNERVLEFFKEKEEKFYEAYSEKEAAIKSMHEMIVGKEATIQAIQESFKEKEGKFYEAYSEKEAAIKSMHEMIVGHESTIKSIHEMVVEKETMLETFRISGLTELLAVFQSERRGLKKVFISTKYFVRALLKNYIQKKNQAAKSSFTVLEPYHVHTFYPPHAGRPKVIHALANFMTGGSSRLVVDLFERLGHCYEQEVVTSYNPDPPSFTGLPIHEFPNRTNPDDILNYFEKVQPDLIHVHYWGDCDKPWYEQVFDATKKYGCKVIENINTPVEPFFADHIDRYTYVSDYVFHQFGKSDKKSLTIYPGSNFDIFKRDSINEVPNDCIGMVYRLEPDKLEEHAIDVFIKVVQSRPETKVLIVGGGTFLESYKKTVCNAGVLDSFNFTGYISYKDLPALYNQMSLFVAPVWKESFGQVSPFAMSTGIPVVGYDIGALSEIIGDKSLLAPPGDSCRLAEIIIDLLNNRERRIEIGRQNRERAHEKFSVEAMIEGYKSLYVELLGR